MIVYKEQGINWHPQSDSLGVLPLKQTYSTHPIVSGLRRLVESLRQLLCFIGCFSGGVTIIVALSLLSGGGLSVVVGPRAADNGCMVW